ncbi:MAG: hypothetical protein U0Z75_00560 [Deinococcaceae bacterium]
MRHVSAAPTRWLDLPKDGLVLEQLPTRYLPLDVLLEELEENAFGGYLEFSFGDQRGRIFFEKGKVVGGVVRSESGQTEVRSPVKMMLDFSDVAFDLISLKSPMDQLAHLGTFAEADSLSVSMDDALRMGQQENWTAVLRAVGTSGQATLFWDQGQLLAQVGSVAGSEVVSLERYGAETAAAESVDLAPENPIDSAESARWIDFWTAVLELSGSAEKIEVAWRSSAVELTDRHPCLDPFAGEVEIEGHQLELHADVPPSELKNALLDAYRVALGKAGISMLQLDFAELKRREASLWALSGIEALFR